MEMIIIVKQTNDVKTSEWVNDIIHSALLSFSNLRQYAIVLLQAQLFYLLLFGLSSSILNHSYNDRISVVASMLFGGPSPSERFLLIIDCITIVCCLLPLLTWCKDHYFSLIFLLFWYFYLVIFPICNKFFVFITAGLAVSLKKLWTYWEAISAHTIKLKVNFKKTW